LDIEDDYSLEEEDGNKDINFDIKTDNGNKKVRITIDGNSDNKRVKKEIKRVENQSDGTKKLIKEKQIGPIHIREEIDLKKNK
jgi:hypothetical protein